MNRSTSSTSPSLDSPPIQATEITLHLDPLGQLIVRDSKGSQSVETKPVRLFPLSQPNQWISLVDQQGREIVCVEELSQLSEENQILLRSELEKREFVPILQRIVWVSGNSEPCQWKVETDRGPANFILKDEKDVRRLGANGVLVVDSHAIRYYVPDRNQLDSHSQRIIEWYV